MPTNILNVFTAVQGCFANRVSEGATWTIGNAEDRGRTGVHRLCGIFRVRCYSLQLIEYSVGKSTVAKVLQIQITHQLKVIAPSFRRKVPFACSLLSVTVATEAGRPTDYSRGASFLRPEPGLRSVGASVRSKYEPATLVPAVIIAPRRPCRSSSWWRCLCAASCPSLQLSQSFEGGAWLSLAPRNAGCTLGTLTPR